MATGFALRNGVAGTVITSITLSFTQENWRLPTVANNTMTAAWGTSATAGVTTSNFLTAAGLTAVPQGNMTGAVTSGMQQQDGNLSANQASRRFPFS